MVSMCVHFKNSAEEFKVKPEIHNNATMSSRHQLQCPSLRVSMNTKSPSLSRWVLYLMCKGRDAGCQSDTHWWSFSMNTNTRQTLLSNAFPTANTIPTTILHSKTPKGFFLSLTHTHLSTKYPSLQYFSSLSLTSKTSIKPTLYTKVINQYRCFHSR